jgi:hypothetical protein
MASAGQIFFASSGSCDGEGSNQSPGTEGITCRQLGGIGSAKATEVDDGCSCESILVLLRSILAL